MKKLKTFEQLDYNTNNWPAEFSRNEKDKLDQIPKDIIEMLEKLEEANNNFFTIPIYLKDKLIEKFGDSWSEILEDTKYDVLIDIIFDAKRY
jgi:hypothetical protein